MKEPDCVMKIMGPSDTLVSDGCKVVCCKWQDGNESHTKQFKYTTPFQWHFQYDNIVDDNNNLHHALPSIDDTCRTDCWPSRVFAFLLALSEVKSYFMMWYFCCKNEEIQIYLNFHSMLAWELINKSLINNEIDTYEEVRRRLRNQYNLLLASKHANG